MSNIDSLYLFIIVSVVCEGLISWIKTVYVEKKLQWQVIVALVISLFLVFDFNINFIALLGVTEKLSVIGYIVTAIFCSRGSNYVFELWNKLTNWKKLNPAGNTDDTATVIESDTKQN
jgi:hypothetical protein